MNTKSIPFRIVDINVDIFELFDTVFDKDTGVEVTTEIMYGVDKEEHYVHCRINYAYHQDVDVLRTTVSCAFEIEGECFGQFFQSKKFILDKYFAQYLATINVGVARGEIHARCELQKSPLSKIILPPINLTEAIPESIEINLC